MNTTHKLTKLQIVAGRIARDVAKWSVEQKTTIWSLMFQVGAFLEETRPAIELVKIYPPNVIRVARMIYPAQLGTGTDRKGMMTAITVELMDMERAGRQGMEAVAEGFAMLQEGGAE